MRDHTPDLPPDLPVNPGDPGDVTAGEAAFLAAVAGPLRAPERLADDFERRLLAAVRADAASPADEAPVRVAAAGRARDWWRRPRPLRVSPLAGLAAAACFAAVVSAATLAATAARRPDARLAAAPSPAPAPSVASAGAAGDTVHIVRFVLVEPGARRVALVGDFNGWSADATPLASAGSPGTWTISVTLPPGRHEYAFLVEDGAGAVRWMRDPFAPPVRDEYGTESSVVMVGASAARRS